jgi:hypothetical protein
MTKVKNLASAILGKGESRTVRVQLKGTGILNMKEVQVFDHNGTNVALNKVTNQSSTSASGAALKAVNGNLTDQSVTNNNAGK